MLTSQEIRDLSRTSMWPTISALSVDWGLIALAFALPSLFPNPVIGIVSFVLIARQQLALAIVMHDAAHKRLFSSVKLNDFVGQFLCAAPLLFSMYSYRTLHLRHHKDPLSPDDPDLSLIGGYPISGKSFARKLLRDALGISYFKFIRYFIHMARKPKSASGDDRSSKASASEKPPPLPIIVGSIVLMNTLLFLALAIVHHPWFYLTLWLLPAITALQVLLRIRGVAEHAGYEANKNQMLNARTVRSSWQTLLFAPHSVNYHIEHHVYPSIPHYNLKKVHDLFLQRNALPQANIFAGYDKVLQDLIKS
jgi:fatty acid desaturase